MKPLSDFFEGIKYISKGFGYFFGNSRLWKYIVVPFLINVILLAGLIAVLYFFLGDLTEFFRQRIGLEFGDYAGIAWYAKIGVFFMNLFAHIVKLLLGLIVIILTGIVFFMLSQLIAAPFYDALTERIEELYTDGKIREVSLWQAIKDIPPVIIVELQKLAILIAIPVSLLVLNLLPFIGNLLYLIFAGSFTCASYGAGFVDYIQAVKRQRFFERFRFARKHFFLLMGFGIPVLIPFLNLFITPFMVTGAALLYLDRQKT